MFITSGPDISSLFLILERFESLTISVEVSKMDGWMDGWKRIDRDLKEGAKTLCNKWRHSSRKIVHIQGKQPLSI